MYARLENENIITYRRLPVQFEDKNGLHLNFRNVADPTKFGFYNVVTPPYDSISQRLGELKFDKKKKVFTYSNVNIGMVKDFILTGSHTPTFPSGTKTVAGTYDGSASNLIQI